MAELVTQIPSCCFPHEADSIELTATAATAVTLKCGTRSMTLNLTPDSAGKILVEDLADVLRDFIPEGQAAQAVVQYDGGERSFTLIPCRVEMGMTAAEFTASHFLTLLRGAKDTYAGATEYLTVFTSSGTRPAFSASLLWAAPQTGEVRTQTVAEAQLGTVTETGQMATLQMQLSFRAPADGFVLHSLTVTCGNRQQGYILSPTLDAQPVTLTFLNSFGQRETFHCFGTVQTELKPTRSTASFAGRTRNFRVEATEELTAQTGAVAAQAVPLFADLCAATRAWDAQGTEICITDNDLKLSNDLYEVQAGSVTWRASARAGHYEPTQAVRTFDDTFDQTFL